LLALFQHSLGCERAPIELPYLEEQVGELADLGKDCLSHLISQMDLETLILFASCNQFLNQLCKAVFSVKCVSCGYYHPRKSHFRYHPGKFKAIASFPYLVHKTRVNRYEDKHCTERKLVRAAGTQK
jgi:hypothetical protein